ncbi:hypothetical protein AVEN_139286-1 [Araneus ventricosus]|uniref:Uncharacterized protein n=1 Tax=Araneus ventricosus TaxID=182803 RepID=A0A4Y1ZSP3_ARAVE|nr:hypothetical protein AVEN_139286-1 [Araneus ventricosus]
MTLKNLFSHGFDEILLLAGASPQLWPHESGGDRIINQLMYVPQGYAELRNATKPRLKEILLYFGRRGWSDLPMGRGVFIRDMCPVNTCQITIDKRAKADLILFKDRFTLPKRHVRPPEQVTPICVHFLEYEAYRERVM